jgi:heat shock protein HtpX
VSPLTPCILAALLAAAPPDPPAANVVLSVVVGPDGAAQVYLVVTGRRLPSEPVARALRDAVDSTAVTSPTAGPTQVWAVVNQRLPGVGDGAGEFDLAPLFAELRAQGVARVQLSVVAPGSASACALGGQPVPSLAPAGAPYQTFHMAVPTDEPDPVLTFAFDLPDPIPLSGPLDFSFDFLTPTPGDPVWLWLLAAVPVGVAALAWRVRRFAARPGIDATTLGFRYWRFQNLLPIGTVTAWLTAVAISGAALHVGTWLPDPGTAARAARWGLLYFLPPAALILLTLPITAPAVRRLRALDWPLADITRRNALAPVALYAVILTFVLGVWALAEGQPRVGVGLILGAIAARVVAVRRRQRLLQLTPVPLTHGELRDRIAELAGRLGVRVPQVGLLPSDRSRLVNAFALANQGVWLSDRLVRGFGRREVDAIAAHELAHLRQFASRRRPRANVGPLGWVIWFVFTAGLTAAIMANSMGVSLRPPAGWPPVDWPSLALAGLVVSLQLTATRQSRGREFGADRAAAEVTGDAAALITALTRLNRINGLPDEWGRWDGLFLTHPPTARRVAALAAAGRLSPEQVAASRALAAADPDPYPIPPSAVAGATVFSPEFRRRVLGRMSWAAMASAVGPPLLAALVADLIGPGPLAVVVLIAGALLPVVVYVLLLNRIATAGGRGLERGVRAKLAAEGIDPAGAVFVSLAPSDELRVFDGFSQWDVGLLWLAGDRLVFAGEHARFVLPRGHVTGVRVGRGLPSWLPTRRVFISWHDPATGAEGTLAVWPGAERSMLRLRRATYDLAGRLQAWRDGEVMAAPPAALADAGPPAFGTVYGVLASQIVQPKMFVRSLLFVGPLAAGLCVLAGVPFGYTVLSGGGYVVAVTALALAWQLLPYWLVPKPRAGVARAVRPPAPQRVP